MRIGRASGRATGLGRKGYFEFAGPNLNRTLTPGGGATRRGHSLENEFAGPWSWNGVETIEKLGCGSFGRKSLGGFSCDTGVFHGE
jgi:hypothetical protein